MRQIGTRAAQIALNDGLSQYYDAKAKAEAKAKAQAEKKKATPTRGKVRVSEGIKLNKADNAILSKVAKDGNVAIVIERFSGADKESKGFYSGGIIHLNADKLSEGGFTYTAIHESVHYVADVNLEGYKVLRYFVEKYYKEKGVELEGEIKVTQEFYKSKGENLSPEEALEEIICNTLSDIATDEDALAAFLGLNKTQQNKLIDILRSIAKKLKEWADKYLTHHEYHQTVINDDALLHLATELRTQMKAAGQKNNTAESGGMRYSLEYNSADVNNEILEKLKKIESKQYKDNEKVYFDDVTTVTAKKIESVVGIDPTGFKMAVEARQLEHIVVDHGKNGASDRSMSDDNDIAKMEYTLYNYDSIVYGGKTKAYSFMRNGYNRTADTVLYEKKIGEKSYYVVQAVPDTKAKTLYVVSAFIGESGYKKETSQLINAKSPDATPEHDSVVVSNNIVSNSNEDVKRKQLEIIQNTNPAPNEYSTWVRTVDDIKTLAETLEDDDWSDGGYFNPDLSLDDIQEAIERGSITVYSSYPIENGVFVSPSRMEAESYSGTGKVYEKTVNIGDVAWIDPTQGQYAKVEVETDIKVDYSLSPENDIEYLSAVESEDTETAQRLVGEAAEATMKDSKIRDESGKLVKVYHGSDSADFFEFDKNRRGQTDSSMYGRGYYFAFDPDYSSDFGENIREFYLDIKNPYYIDINAPASKIANFLKSKGVKVDFDYSNMICHFFAKNFGSQKFADTLVDLGYDGVVARTEEGVNFEAVAFHRNQMKLADAITYDDAGKVIPLSERFGKKRDVRYSFEGYAEDGKGKYKSNYPKGTPRKAKGERILHYIQDVWSKNPITLRIEKDGVTSYIEAKFDPDYDPSENRLTDASKLMGGNRHGTSSEQRVTLDLADDYYKIASEAKYNYSKDETGKYTPTHEDVKEWHYFVNDIYFSEFESDEYVPYRVTINVKEKNNGHFVYSFSAEKQEETSSQRTLHAVVNGEATAKGTLSKNIVPNSTDNVKQSKMTVSYRPPTL